MQQRKIKKMEFYHTSPSNQPDILPTNPYTWDQKDDSHSELPLLPQNMNMHMNQVSTSGSYLDLLSRSSISSHSCIEVPSLHGPDEISYSGQNLQRQGLSLSLGTHRHYSNMGGMSSILSNYLPISVDETKSSKGDAEYLIYDVPENSHEVSNTESLLNYHLSVNPNRTRSDPYPNMCENRPGLENSKYLKAVQGLLDEIVSVQMAWKKPDKCRKMCSEIDGGIGRSSINGMSPAQPDITSPGELSIAERQDLQKKKTKLLSMLDEVDRKYKQYYNQMEMVISSFDYIAGAGSAKRYTELARKTISSHFRNLRDSIACQIQATQRNLGEQDTVLTEQGIPRLRYVDHNLKQQRSIQQIGLMRHAWRPQRGLPESSVSILRAWLFEHFLNPYPKDSEKIMLARQTGLTRSQVANWFINARVRLWKPMVEEMHKEEFGDSVLNSNSLPENPMKETELTPENAGEPVINESVFDVDIDGHTFDNQVSLALGLHNHEESDFINMGYGNCIRSDDEEASSRRNQRHKLDKPLWTHNFVV